MDRARRAACVRCGCRLPARCVLLPRLADEVTIDRFRKRERERFRWQAAEGAARQSLADKSRAYAIALAECCEACAAVEIAGALGACSAADVRAVLAIGVRTKNVLSRLAR